MNFLKCDKCGSHYSLEEDLMLCRNCNYPLMIKYDLDRIHEIFDFKRLSGRVHSIWRYFEFLPRIEGKFIVSLMEGLTPIIDSARISDFFGLRGLKFKLEYLNPTGSLKDRGSTLLVSWVNRLGVKSIADDSSGNAGISLSAYSARAGINCTIYVPEHTPIDKIIQAISYGANVVRVSGGRTETSREIMKLWRMGKLYYASHNMSPFFLDGFKTFAYEVIEQLNGDLPDHIIIPTGGGSLFLGAYRGFVEAKAIGWIKDIPKLHIVQPEACNPIVRAFERRLSNVEPIVEGETIAGGLRIVNPPRGESILKALYDCGGVAVSVSESEIIDGYIKLAKEGIFAEPTSATVIPALKRLLDLNVIRRDEKVLLPITGFGLKDVKTAIKIFHGEPKIR